TATCSSWPRRASGRFTEPATLPLAAVEELVAPFEADADRERVEGRQHPVLDLARRRGPAPQQQRAVVARRHAAAVLRRQQQVRGDVGRRLAVQLLQPELEFGGSRVAAQELTEQGRDQRLVV